jgi:hypothetical protein
MLPHQLLITPCSFGKRKGKKMKISNMMKESRISSFEFGELIIMEILIPLKTHPPPPPPSPLPPPQPQSLFYKLLGPKPRVVPNGLDVYYECELCLS